MHASESDNDSNGHIAENDALSCLVRYDPPSGHHWGKLLPTVIMSAIGGLADNLAGRELSPFGKLQTLIHRS